MCVIFREVFASLERDAYLPGDAVVTGGKSSVGNETVTVRCFVLQLFVNSFSDA